jgi:DNA-binding winged helix-turn-helix (wHTH) protein/TolB-like protein/Tfp pilus assembly protein PilF
MAMSRQAKQLYEFGPFCIDVAERLLLRDCESVPLTPKAFDLLLVLVENRGHLLEKDELMQRLWPETFVEETNLSNNISLLRKALGDDSGKHLYIETVPRRGYRFVAEVVESTAEPVAMVVEERSRTRLTLEDVSEAEQLEAGGQREAARKRLVLLPLAAAIALIGLGYAAYYFWPKQSALQPPIRSIAVLPFKPLVADDRDEALEIGMAETLITKLSGLRAIIVRPLGLVRKYAVLEQDPVAAGRELGVESVLDSTIQKSGDRIRATVRLVRVADAGQLWADKFDEKFTELFAVQDSISERVAAALAVKLTGEEKGLLAKHYTDNSQAYQLYLKGHYYSWQFTDYGAKKAIEYFNQAIALDPEYAQAYAGLAESYAIRSGETLSPGEAMPKAKDAALKALALDDSLADTHYALALIYWWTWDFPEAEQEFERTLQLNPNEAEVHFSYGQYLAERGRIDEAIRAANQALQSSSLSASAYVNAAYIAYLAHQYDQAIEQSREALELDRNFNRGHLVLGKAYMEKGLYDQAIIELEKALELPSGKLGMLGYAYAVAGRISDARKVLDRLGALSRERYISPFEIARIHVGLGDKDRAFEWLERAYRDRSDYLNLLRSDPTFDSLHSDPRFEGLIRRVGLP